MHPNENQGPRQWHDSDEAGNGGELFPDSCSQEDDENAEDYFNEELHKLNLTQKSFKVQPQSPAVVCVKGNFSLTEYKLV
jgi:hypothetical protein